MRVGIGILAVAATVFAQEPESPTFQATVFGTTVVTAGALEGKIYYLLEGTYSLPNFRKLKPVGTIYAKRLNIPNTDFREGFPGVTNRFEWFAIEYTGKFYAAQAGKYTFQLVSDDGSKLWIDGKTVVDNDGHHGMLAAGGSVNLRAGVHDLRLGYFQGPRYEIGLIFEVGRPGEKRFRVFDTDDFSPDREPKPKSEIDAAPALRTTADAGKPPLEEQTKLLQMAAKKAVGYAAELPDFLCAETVDRMENRASNLGWRIRDTLTVGLSYSQHQEHHKLLAVNGNTTQATYESVGGATSGGEFGGFLRETFWPELAKFDWVRVDRLRGQTVFVFRYQIAPEKSQFTISYRNAAGVQRLVVGHNGLVFIDPGTAEVLRLVRIAELPKDISVRKASATLDYAPVELGGHTYLLPAVAQVEVSLASIQTRNVLTFGKYRKFEAGSEIAFGDKQLDDK